MQDAFSYPAHRDPARLSHLLDATGASIAGLEPLLAPSFNQEGLEMPQLHYDLAQELIAAASYLYGLSICGGVADTTAVRGYLNRAAMAAASILPQRGTISPVEWMRWLGVNDLTENDALRFALEGVAQESLAASTPSRAAIELATHAKRALAWGPPERQPELSEYAALLDGDRLSPVDRGELWTLYRLVHAGLSGDADAVRNAAGERAEYLTQTYEDEDARHRPEALLDLSGLGALAFARRAGLDIGAGSVYHDYNRAVPLPSE